jgi:hypothetical protein
MVQPSRHRLTTAGSVDHFCPLENHDLLSTWNRPHRYGARLLPTTAPLLGPGRRCTFHHAATHADGGSNSLRYKTAYIAFVVPAVGNRRIGSSTVMPRSRSLLDAKATRGCTSTRTCLKRVIGDDTSAKCASVGKRAGSHDASKLVAQHCRRSESCLSGHAFD